MMDKRVRVTYQQGSSYGGGGEMVLGADRGRQSPGAARLIF